MLAAVDAFGRGDHDALPADTGHRSGGRVRGAKPADDPLRLLVASGAAFTLETVRPIDGHRVLCCFATSGLGPLVGIYDVSGDAVVRASHYFSDLGTLVALGVVDSDDTAATSSRRAGRYGRPEPGA